MIDADALDLLVEAATASGYVSAGVDPRYVAAKSPHLGPRGMAVVARGGGKRTGRAATWSAEDDNFIAENSGRLSLAEIAAALGRTVDAVKIRRTRQHMPAPIHLPDEMTAEQIALGLGLRCSKDVHRLIDRGILPGRRLPMDHVTRVVGRDQLLSWIVRPRNWIYFDPRQLGRPTPGMLTRNGRQPESRSYDYRFWDRARRLVGLACSRWHDEWWETGRVARYYGLASSTVVNHAILAGRLPAARWGNWFVLRSDALACPFYPGKGNPGASRTAQWSPAADDWLVLARAVGHSWEQLGRLMRRDVESIRVHYKTLKVRRGAMAAILRRNGYEFVRDTDGSLCADWREYRDRFPAMARDLERLQNKARLDRTEGRYLARILRKMKCAPKLENRTNPDGKASKRSK